MADRVGVKVRETGKAWEGVAGMVADPVVVAVSVAVAAGLKVKLGVRLGGSEAVAVSLGVSVWGWNGV